MKYKREIHRRRNHRFKEKKVNKIMYSVLINRNTFLWGRFVDPWYRKEGKKKGGRNLMKWKVGGAKERWSKYPT